MNTPALNILIVEDNDDFRENLASLIKEEIPASEVKQAADVEEGKVVLSGREKFDIVILDFRLPVPGGGQQIDTSLCNLTRTEHPNSLVIHVTMNKDHPEASRHMQEVHGSTEKSVAGQDMETQHMGILISKAFPEGGDVNDPKEAERLGNEILTAITRRVNLKTIEAGLDNLLGGASGGASGWSRGVGRVVVPDAGLTSHLASLRLALECAWPWLPESVKTRARHVFSIQEAPGAPGRVRIQML